MADQATPIQALKEKKQVVATRDGAADFANNPGTGDQSTPLKRLKEPEMPVLPVLPGPPNVPVPVPPVPPGPGLNIPQGPPLPSMGDVDPRMRNLQTPINVPVPSGVSQGQSLAERAGPFSRKEFFGIGEEWKSALLVFALVLIFGSGMFYGVLRPYAPSLAGMDGRGTLLGYVVSAVVAALLFLLIKFAAKF